MSSEWPSVLAHHKDCIAHIPINAGVKLLVISNLLNNYDLNSVGGTNSEVVGSNPTQVEVFGLEIPVLIHPYGPINGHYHFWFCYCCYLSNWVAQSLSSNPC